MYVLLIVIHLLTAFVMVGAILLQSGKGAEIGATFGGSSQTIFGGRGATTFLAKFTAGCAVVFMLTSLGLAILSKERSVGTSLKLPTPPPVSSTPSEPSASSTPAPATAGTAATSPAPAASTPAPPSAAPASPAGHEGMSMAPSPAASSPAPPSPAPAAPAKP